MAYEVLARKWRPQQFDEVVGQQHVTRTLCNAIAAKRIAHAYLFVGPRGIGKTSIARIFAKALNCAKGPTPTPCGVCDSCREITDGSSLDVLEFDAASNTQVDKVREIIVDRVSYSPARGPFKVYIVDEVHMLSTSSFNALLKTLEEPPAHVKFIFATTEAQKVPTTIVSRCQRFDLRRIPLRDILCHLAKIATAEGIEAGDDALLAIARGAEGGLRDAESALDQLISFRGKTIGEDDVLSVFGLVSRKRLEDLADAVLRGDMAALVATVGELDANGKNLGRVLVEMIEHLRNVLIARSVGGTGALDVSEAQAETLAGQAARTDEARLLRMIEILMESEGRVRHSLSPRTLLETTLLRCARAATMVSVDVLIRRLNECKAMLDAAPDGEAGSAPVAAPSRLEPAAPYAPSVPPPAAGDRPPTAARIAEPGDDAPIPGDPAAVWTSALAVLTAAKPRLRSDLRDTRILSIAGDRVVVGIDRDSPERLPQLDTPANRDTLAKVLSRSLQRPVQVAFELADRPADPIPPPAHPARAARVPAAEPPPPPTSAPGDDADKRKARKKLIEDPAVKSLMKTFGGRITDIRE
jgi:DNA polymerase-3 subunit gamma/tau